MHPAVRINGRGGLLLIIPIAQHDAVSTGAEFACHAALHGLPRGRIDDLDFHVRVHLPDRSHPLVDRRVQPGLRGHRAGFGHAIGDLHTVQVHAPDGRVHDFHRARGARHDAGAQTVQFEAFEFRVFELGNEHGRHAMQRRGTLILHGLQHGSRIKRIAGQNHGRAVADAGQVAHHHAETVVQGHGDDQPVLVGKAHQLSHEMAIVQNVAVAERRALGPAGSAAGVLDIDGVVRGQLRLALRQFDRTHLLTLLHEIVPPPHPRSSLFRIPVTAKANHVPELGQAL